MRSAQSSDLTAKARIRDAAITLFGKGGYAKTSVRGVAALAGTSAALVIHHFGSKEGLKQACDRYVVDDVIGRGEELLAADIATTLRLWLDDPDQFRGAYDYVVRMITEPSELGAALFDGLVARTERMVQEGAERGEMRPSSDPHMLAVLLATQGLGPLLLEHHIGRTLGESGLSSAVFRRMAVPTLELYTHGLYTTSAYLDATLAALGSTREG